MKKIMYILLFTVLPAFAAAQVEKHVEVAKDYVPSVAGAAKLPIQPDMVDTTKLRPEIDYSITPLSMATTLSAAPIRPATVTYWEFNRHKPFYVKLGAGWPFNSVADIYATTQNAGTGYLMGYINHDGRYADIRNDFGVKDNATRMYNRIGVAAGKYLGRHTLEGEFSYDNRLFHRYGAVLSEDARSLKAAYGEFGVLVRFGDDFTDLSRTNFNIALRGTLFNDHSDMTEGMSHARQTHLGVDFALGRRFGRHLFRVQAMYEHGAGARAIADYGQDILSAGVRYGYAGGVVNLELGADYYYDKIVGVAERHYVLPALRLRFNLGTEGFAPYAEVDGRLRDNSLRTLSRLNPFVRPETWCDKSTVDYNFRVGAGGSVAKGKLTYRLFVGASIRENQLFWTFDGVPTSNLFLQFVPMQAHQTLTSFNGELEFRPSSRFRLDVGLHGYAYDDDTVLESGRPAFEGMVGARYTAKKVSFGVRATMQSRRVWSQFSYNALQGESQIVGTYDVPFTLDLSADVDWHLKQSLSLFAEVRNIANMKLYNYPYYPEYGVNFTVGVKFTF